MRKVAALCLLACACSDPPPEEEKVVWGTCPNEQHGTAESLREKAAYYDELATRLHIHPAFGVALNVTLKPGVAEETATIADVERFHTGENDGLWSGLYLTSQAYRYAVTKSPEALATIRLLLDAEAVRMRITGVPGIFTRTYISPTVPGTSCPMEQERYVPDVEKDDNRWVKIEDDGCVHIVDRDTMMWTATGHCGLDEFKGWCFLDNVSKDEYAGNMLALGALLKYVDDPEVQRIARDLLGQVGQHLLANDLVLLDWDGRPTEHGRFSPIALDDFPGFNAAMALAYVAAAKEATGSAELTSFYRQCLLQKDGGGSCIGLIDPDPFTEYLEAAGMYVGPEGCRSNYNNISMHMLSLHTLLWFEHDPVVRKMIQRSLEVDVVKKEGEPRAIISQHNALFDFIWAADKEDSGGPAYEAVEDGICQLKQFRKSQADASVTPDPAVHPAHCKNRFDDDVSAVPREAWERCSGTFVWWGDPYSLGGCSANDREINQPAGYLLPYWMGRYYGFIAEDL